MTTKSDFTPEEWNALLRGPLATNLYIVVADPSVFGSIKEVMAFSKDIIETLTQPDTAELLRFMLADLQDKNTLKGVMPEIKGDPATVKAELKKLIQASVSLLNDKATPEESQHIRQWMYDLAVRTAEAARKGGFLSIGSVRVSEQEKQALAELTQLLGVDHGAESGTAKETSASPSEKEGEE